MVMNNEKKALSFLQICNMSVGFFGIQFGWGLQMGNMSAIYEFLGASESELPLLWLAAPLTGLIVQPIIGHMSDNTWCWLGRRRPYFLIGAVLSSIALVLMPNCGALWMAAGLLWILDASVNISMEPFRAFVADLLPERQRTVGFAMQSVFIGAGAVIASKLPGWLADYGVASDTSAEHPIPRTVHVAFTVGAIVFFLAVLWTVVTTREHPRDETLDSSVSHKSGLAEIWDAFLNMPARMKHLAAVQFLTWMGLFCMWIFFSVAVARDILGATDTESPLYKEGLYLANNCFATYNLVAFFTAIVFLWIGRFMSPKWLHVISLLCGGLGLASVLVVRDPTILTWGSFAGVGIAWASILSMPYAMLSGALPERRIGVYMGIFNLFIVIPQILVAIVLSRVLANFEELSRLHIVVFGGICMILAALITAMIPYQSDSVSKEQLADG
jgi:maltose/moltooligosaccharide transporter